MTSGELNLAPPRGPSVWDKKTLRPNADPLAPQRWALAITAATVAAYGARRLFRGDIPGLLMGLFGTTLAYRALRGANDIYNLRMAIERVWASMGWSREDVVADASDASFPASDAPAWTPMKGTATPSERRQLTRSDLDR